ncbi:MAG: segregation/condensation protein A [Clostridia bacterium]|nr:segregation/condensation protein A [Clostridia bacterium]
MAFSLHLSQFEGPLDMLLFLISKAKVDIKDIFVSEVTQQYIDFVQHAPDLDMDDASGFLAMAATLVEIKSRALLPREPREGENEEEDPEAALIRQLEEYRILKGLTAEMQQFEKAAAAMYEKLPEEYPLPPPTFELEGLTLEGLTAAFARVLARKPREDEEEGRAPQRRIIRDLYSVPRCMASIVRRLKKGPIAFSRLFQEDATRDEVVSTFLALLELLKAGRASASQDGTYGEIVISPRTPDPEQLNPENTNDVIED